MPTTTVRKGAGRATATANTNRHAQRTALPPKAGVVADAQEVIASVAKATPRKRAPRKTQADLVAEITEAEQVRTERAALKARKADAAEALAASQEMARKVAPPAAEKAVKAKKSEAAGKTKAGKTPKAEKAAKPEKDSKAVRNAAIFTAHGWETRVESTKDSAEMIAVRGTETVHQTWIREVWQPNAATYTIGDRTVKPRNAAEAQRWAVRTPEEAVAEFGKVSVNKAFRKREVEPVRRVLPFDPMLATDAEVLTAIAGSRVAWHNRFSQEEETALVRPTSQHTRIIVAPDGQRVVMFCCPESGFRAFRVSALTRVGGSSRRRSTTAEPHEAQAA